MEIGELIGRGRTSDVYSYGAGAVIKIADPDVPLDWPGYEARQNEAVRAEGAPAPRVLDLIDIDGRTAVVFERIEGPSLWQQMLDTPSEAPRMVREFAAIQRSLLNLNIPTGLPDFVDRLMRKIDVAPWLSDADRIEAKALVGQLPRGAALLHGDLHPGNILMSADGPVVIDWFDAAVGHPISDISRSSVLMQPQRWRALDHLPGASVELLDVVHASYVSEFAAELDYAQRDVATWRAVLAVGRLAERAEPETGLIRLWEERSPAAQGSADEPAKFVGNDG